jgi:hypothetical protein
MSSFFSILWGFKRVDEEANAEREIIERTARTDRNPEGSPRSRFRSQHSLALFRLLPVPPSQICVVAASCTSSKERETRPSVLYPPRLLVSYVVAGPSLFQLYRLRRRTTLKKEFVAHRIQYPPCPLSSLAVHSNISG